MAGWIHTVMQSRLQRLLVATLVACGLTFLPFGALQAQAAIPVGPGYQIPNPDRPSMIGGYLAPDGTVLYCLQWGAQSPTGPNDPILGIQQTNQYADWSHLEIARVNYIISKWGQTSSNDQAAAVQMAIWMRHPGGADPFFPEHRFVKATIRDDATRARIAEQARAMSAEADRFTPYARAAVGTVEVVPDAENPFAGEIRVSGLPEHTLGTVQLEGAVLETTNSASAAGVSNGEVLRYRGIPSDSDIGSYRVTADATFVTAGSPNDELVVWKTPDGFQDLGQSSTVIPDFEFSLTGAAEIPIPFEPELSTVAASTLVQTGEPLRDTVSLSLAEGSLPWRTFSDGTFQAIDGWCQAYGPLEEQPELTAEPPAHAPEFGEPVAFQVGGTTENPLESSVVAEFDEKPTEAGYYTFVCGIAEQKQSSVLSSQALPAGYEFQHEYGLVAETTLVSAPLAHTGNSGIWAVSVAVTTALGLLGVVLVFVRKHLARTS